MHVNGKLLENIPEENNAVTSRELVTKLLVRVIQRDANTLDQQSQEFTSQNVLGLKEDHSKEEENVVHSQKDVKTTNVKQERFTANSQLEFFIMDVDGRESLNVSTKDVQLFLTVTTNLQ